MSTQAYRFPANIRVTSEDCSCSHEPPNFPCVHPRSHEEGRLFNFRHICYGGYDRQVRREENINQEKRAESTGCYLLPNIRDHFCLSVSGFLMQRLEVKVIFNSPQDTVMVVLLLNVLNFYHAS